MAIKESLRPGGRSARVQQSVHQAVNTLLAQIGRDALSVPLIAAQAGVTPSTIYRRWGDLGALLADVSVARMRPDSEPADTGSLRGDLLEWLAQYFEEITSVPGRQMIHDSIVGGCPNRCFDIIREQMQVILARAGQRGEASPPADALIDALVAPGIFRIVFGQQDAPSQAHLAETFDRLI